MAEVEGNLMDSPLLPPVTDQQRELGNQALKEFQNSQYGTCISVLNKLAAQLSKQPSIDVKVAQNKAVAEFCQTNLRNVNEFRKKLNSFAVNFDSFNSVEDMDHAFLFYNHSVVLYHLRQYQAALSVLDKLFSSIDPLEESLARRMVILMVELYLCTYQPDRAIGMLNYMEKKFFSEKSSTPEKSERGSNSKEGETTTESWKSCMNMYKVRCWMMLKSLKLCKKELKSIVGGGSGSNATCVTYLKSNFEYLRGNLRKAIKMLGSDPQAQVFTNTGECLPMIYFNNLGCIHLHLKKHHLGAFYFRRAVQENENALKDASAGGPRKALHNIGMSRHFELLHNMGVQLLHCGQPLAAFDCLIEAVQVYQVNPRIWLRLAECCIQANREDNDDDRSLEKRMQVVHGSVGRGIHRKLVLGTGVQQAPISTTTPSMPCASLEFASLCLRNALLLLPEEAPVLAPPGNPLKVLELAHLRCSVLAASAYIALCLSDHLLALQHATNLLKQPHISGAQRYVGSLYMAEAQVVLDKVADAISHLNPDLVTDINVCPPDKSDIDKGDKSDLLGDSSEVKCALFPWIPKDVSQAKAIMQYNLAAAHATRGEYDKAMTHLTGSSHNIGTPLPAQMYFLKLYLDLMEGRRKMAQSVLKEHFGHITPNRG